MKSSICAFISSALTPAAAAALGPAFPAATSARRFFTKDMSSAE